MQVVTSGVLSPFSVTAMTLTTTGSTNPATDINNYRLYFSGTTGTFGGTLIASGASIASLTFAPQVLANGTNYFWLAYDVPISAMVSNLLDATCADITMNRGVGIKIPTVTAPAGSRTIIGPVACGIINSYAAVIDLCQSVIKVDNASPFFVEDKILIIQMKGASIDLSNTASFGTITSYGNAGNYEYNFVNQVIGNDIYLQNALLRTYDVAGKIQVVKVAQYAADVTVDIVPVTCPPLGWRKGRGSCP